MRRCTATALRSTAARDLPERPRLTRRPGTTLQFGRRPLAHARALPAFPLAARRGLHAETVQVEPWLPQDRRGLGLSRWVISPRPYVLRSPHLALISTHLQAPEYLKSDAYLAGVVPPGADVPATHNLWGVRPAAHGLSL